MEKITLGIARRMPSDDIKHIKQHQEEQRRKRIERQAGGIEYDAVLLAAKVARTKSEDRPVREKDWGALPPEIRLFLSGVSPETLKAAATAAKKRPGAEVGRWRELGAALLT